MSELRCVVQRVGTDVRWEVPLANHDGAWPHDVGASPDCVVYLDDEALPPRAARLWPGGLHVFVEALAEGVRVRDEAVKVGERVRLGGPFRVGAYELEVAFAGEPYEE